MSAAQVSTLIGSEAKGQNSVLLTGYGAYGISDDPEFDYRRLPLLDRGVVFAVAHIRGGGEVGFVSFSSSSSFLSFTNASGCIVYASDGAPLVRKRQVPE